MSVSPPPGLFKPAQQRHTVATLILIENSAAMMDRWPDLRDRYLPTLLGTMRMANPVVPIQVFWLTSSPVSQAEEAISHSNGSRQYNQLPETFPETPTTRHLFVVAASGPSASMEVPGLPGADPQTIWQALGSKLTQANIHLHMILNPKVTESGNFAKLFYDILGMQNFQEAWTWFPTDTDNYRFYLSMRPQAHHEGPSRSLPSASPLRTHVGYASTASAVSPSLLTSTSGISGLSLASPITGPFPDASALPPPPPLLPTHPLRVPLPRNNSFPPASANGRTAPRQTTASSTNNSPPPSVASIPSDAELKPGLVKHLQRIHGLTKKRNYGLQSSRAPFIRDETASSPYTSAHSVDPVNGRPRRNTGVYASKNKIGEDPRRPRRGSVHFSLPESARVSSPESDSSKSPSAPSPTATVAGVLASPSVPVTVGLQLGMPLSSPTLNLTEPSYAAVPPPPGPPPLWQGETLGQAAPATPGPAFTDILPPQAHALSPAQVHAQVQQAHARAAAPLASSSYANVPHGNADAPVVYSTTAHSIGSSSYVSQSSALHTPPSSALSPTTATDDGDKPFIFYPEYEEALIPPPPLFTPHSAATQPMHVAQYWSTASTDYSHILNPAVSPGLLRANPPPVYDIPVYDSPAHSPPVHPHASSHTSPGIIYASEQSSSLQSWAGY
ncbi:hypothetical protein B0F90DRAFT_566876 [Multifurca ochricompacta]|uniref:Uncharacterized protein n=1 Tax=Multifurca ochricompacta TaxID=376703 RepID=A0AAD4M2T5_9AGAM|nr:hypothetical protein B0F90DRAFT_566876 [Multifurca ochricompacta]